MGGLVGVLVLAAWPNFGEPSQLVDIETGPSRTTRPQLIEANDDGALYTQLERDGGTALFWGRWEGAPERVLSVVLDAGIGGIKARRLGDGFIVFNANEVSRVDVASPVQVTPLIEARVRSFPESNSTSRLWWSSEQDATFVTDGTPEGTRLVASGATPQFVLGDSLFFGGNTTLRRWTDNEFVDTGLDISRGIERAGDHLLLGGTPARNELGEDVSASRRCDLRGGGDSAWLSCTNPDGGEEVLVSDGTAAGTWTRHSLGGRLGAVSASSADYFVFLSVSAPGSFLLTRAGSGPPVPVGFCSNTGSILGDVLVAGSWATPLAGEVGACTSISEVKAARQAGRRALLQVEYQSRFVLTDGTDAGSLSVPAELPAWPTDSSFPHLIGTDGVHALFSTTRGAWITDGTPTGTKRIGNTAQFFGHSILADDDGRFIVITRSGDRWEPPLGVIGVAGGLLIGRSGCDAFTVDEDHVRREVQKVGCISEIKAGTEGALLRNADEITSLVREEGTFPLAGDVELVNGVRCGKKVCWYLSKQDATHLANVIDLETGGNSTVPTILTETTLELVAANDSAVAITHDRGVFVVRRSGGRVVIENRDQLRFPFETPTAFVAQTASGTIVWFASSGSGVNGIDGKGDSFADVTCDEPLGLRTAGERVSLLCINHAPMGAKRTLWSGTLADGLEAIAVGGSDYDSEQPFLPSGDGDVFAYTMASGVGASRLVVTDGKERHEYPGLRGADFTRTHNGYVFAATTDLVQDVELWVLPAPPTGCGCSGGGAELALVLAVLLFRRSRATVA